VGTIQLRKNEHRWLELIVLLIGSILKAPFKGLIRIFEEVQKAAREEQKREKADITENLSLLYQKLSKEEITEEEFDAQEKILLDRLEQINESE